MSIRSNSLLHFFYNLQNPPMRKETSSNVSTGSKRQKLQSRPAATDFTPFYFCNKLLRLHSLNDLLRLLQVSRRDRALTDHFVCALSLNLGLPPSIFADENAAKKAFENLARIYQATLMIHDLEPTQKRKGETNSSLTFNLS